MTTFLYICIYKEILKPFKWSTLLCRLYIPKRDKKRNFQHLFLVISLLLSTTTFHMSSKYLVMWTPSVSFFSCRTSLYTLRSPSKKNARNFIRSFANNHPAVLLTPDLIRNLYEASIQIFCRWFHSQIRRSRRGNIANNLSGFGSYSRWVYSAFRCAVTIVPLECV